VHPGIIILVALPLVLCTSPVYAQLDQNTSIDKNSKIIPSQTQLVYFGLAMGVSIGAVLLIVSVGKFTINKLTVATITTVTGGVSVRTQIRSKFREILNDDNYYPSLAIFQFLAWTIIILFVVTSIFFIKIFNGVYLFDEETYNIPYNILILMGLSVAVPVASSYVSSVKYGNRNVSGSPPTQHPFGSILAENGKPSLSRFQMFAWTWISVIFYLISFISHTYYSLHDVSTLNIPDVPGVFVILMGLSQGAYVGGKIVLKQIFEVTQVIPAQAQSTIPFELTILGSNFGTDKELTIWFYKDANDKNPIKGGTVRPQTDNRIVLNLVNVPPAGTYIVRVEKEGQFTSNDTATIVIS
jgi:hypothetical protein